MDFREGLGEYAEEDGNRFPFGYLTLHELAELIRRAGKASGFIVQAEYKVSCRAKNRPKLDWVWLDFESRRPIVAFEIEGRYVNRRSQDNDFEKWELEG